MKQVCLLCERATPDTNLFCQEIYCQAERSPIIFGYGEWLGDIEIIRPVTVLRSGVVYEAAHQDKQVFLKVAHTGREHQAKLIREASFLQKIQLRKKRPAYLPALLPPYVGTSIQQDAFGMAAWQGDLLYFYLFEFVEGEPLRDILTKTPQLWLQHIGWIVISLSYTVAFLHNQGLLHLGLVPEAILVRFDKNQPKAPRLLLIDLGVATDQPKFRENWHPTLVPPAYTAPELLKNSWGEVGHQTDVYGLGLILYEMLIGQPAYPFKLRSDEEVRSVVQDHKQLPQPMNRSDSQRVAEVALQAVSIDVKLRPSGAAVLAAQLMSKNLFGKIPKPKQSPWPSLKTILAIAGALLAAAVIIALALQPELLLIVLGIVMVIGLIAYWRFR